MTEPATDEASLQLQLISARADNLILRTRLAAPEHRNKHLRNKLRKYENPNIPPSKEGGAGETPDGDSPTDQDDENAGDDAPSDDEATSDESEQTQDGDAGGDRVTLACYDSQLWLVPHQQSSTQERTQISRKN